LDVNEYKFVAAGKRILRRGWTEIYEPYLSTEELILPELRVGQVLKVDKLATLRKRNPASRKVHSRQYHKGDGEEKSWTRSTRAEILQTLYDRKYIQGRSIQVRKLGEAVAKALKEFCPRILSEELTRKLKKKHT